MTRIIFNLSDAEEAALRQQAKREYRAPRDQARLLLMRALGFIEGEAETVEPRKMLYGEVIQDTEPKAA